MTNPTAAHRVTVSRRVWTSALALVAMTTVAIVAWKISRHDERVTREPAHAPTHEGTAVTAAPPQTVTPVAPSNSNLVAPPRLAMSYDAAWTTPSANIDPLRVSPDGRYVAYLDFAQNGDVFLHDMVTLTDRRLTIAQHGDSSLPGVAFSRDGTRLAYGWFDQQLDHAQLRVIDLDNTSLLPTVVLDDRTLENVEPYDWTPDGKWIAVRLDRADRTAKVVLLSATDGSLRVLKGDDAHATGALCLSPNGEFLAFDLRRPNSRARDIMIVSTDGRHETPAVANRADDNLVGWTPDGTRLVFTSDKTGPHGLWTVQIRGGAPNGEPDLVRDEDSLSTYIGVTASGSLYSVGYRTATSAIRTASVDFTTGDVLSPPSDLPEEYAVGQNRSPNWSPDGRSLAYVTQRGKGLHEPTHDFTVAIRSLDTNRVQQLKPNLDYVLGSPGWSPDSKFLVLRGADFTGRSGFWLLDRTTEQVSVLSLDEPGTIIGSGIARYPPIALGGWSPDGLKAYILRPLGAGGEIALVERDIVSGDDRELFRAPFRNGQPRISPDGTKLYYRNLISNPSSGQAVTFVERDLASGTEREVIRRQNLGAISVSPDGQSLATGSVDPSTKSRSILLVPIGTGAPTELITSEALKAPAGSSPIALTVYMWARDSRSILVQETFGPSRPTELWWVPTDGRAAPKQVHLGDNLTPDLLSVQPDGHRLAFSVWQKDRQPATVWRLQNFGPPGLPGPKK